MYIIELYSVTTLKVICLYDSIKGSKAEKDENWEKDLKAFRLINEKLWLVLHRCCSALVRGSVRNTFCWHWPLAAFGLAARVAICQTWLSWLVTITQHATTRKTTKTKTLKGWEKRPGRWWHSFLASIHLEDTLLINKLETSSAFWFTYYLNM